MARVRRRTRSFTRSTRAALATSRAHCSATSLSRSRAKPYACEGRPARAKAERSAGTRWARAKTLRLSGAARCPRPLPSVVPRAARLRAAIGRAQALPHRRPHRARSRGRSARSGPATALPSSRADPARDPATARPGSPRVAPGSPSSAGSGWSLAADWPSGWRQTAGRHRRWLLRRCLSGAVVSHGRIRSVFEHFDVDCDGSLDKAEFPNAVKALLGRDPRKARELGDGDSGAHPSNDVARPAARRVIFASSQLRPRRLSAAKRWHARGSPGGRVA